MTEHRAQKASRWIEFIGVFAVVLSLVLVARELQQNTEATIGEISQGQLAMLVEIDGWLVDGDFAELVARVEGGSTSLSPKEAIQYAYWIYGKFNLCENVFDRHQAGLVSEDYWIAWEGGCRRLLEPPFAQEVWRDRRGWYGPAFRAHFDAKLAELTSKVPE